MTCRTPLSGLLGSSTRRLPAVVERREDRGRHRISYACACRTGSCEALTFSLTARSPPHRFLPSRPAWRKGIRLRFLHQELVGLIDLLVSLLRLLRNNTRAPIDVLRALPRD